jgi:hypothetical protein
MVVECEVLREVVCGGLRLLSVPRTRRSLPSRPAVPTRGRPVVWKRRPAPANERVGVVLQMG